MFSEKVKIELSSGNNIGFKFNGEDLIVKEHFNINEKIEFINEYLNNISDTTQTLGARYLIAEHALKLQIIDRCSNVLVDNDLDADDIISSGLWEAIKKRINDYEDFRKDLDKVISMWQAQESVGAILKNVSDKLMVVLNNLSQMDVDKLKDVTDNFVGELDKLNNTAPGIIGGKPARRRNKKQNI